MTDYLTEQEQIELFKSWFKQYSLVIVAGIVIALLTVSGWRYWQQRQLNTLHRASSAYNDMMMQQNQSDSNNAVNQARAILATYPKTVYAQLAALMLAKNAILNKNYNDAENKLNWVLAHSKIPSFKQIARIRLARVLIAENKPQQAIDHLITIDDKSFTSLTDEVRGDAYLVMKNTARARESYQAALSALPNAESSRPLLQMKYENLTTINSGSSALAPHASP